jgi:hypothetical protein
LVTRGEKQISCGKDKQEKQGQKQILHFVQDDKQDTRRKECLLGGEKQIPLRGMTKRNAKAKTDAGP